MSMLVRFRFGYDCPVPTADELAALKQVVPAVDVDGNGKFRSWEEYVANLESVYHAFPKAVVSVQSLAGVDVPRLLVETIERLEALEAQMTRGRFNNEETYNAKVNVHVPGLGLLLIDEVKIEEDYCTERLQHDIDDGWRIIAACPQPDRRRPDYVLGRTKAK